MARVALCGVFDIANYGDHLFPLILRMELKKHGYQGDVVLFSPFAATESFVENSTVYSLNDMESMFQQEPFDAIIVGGGEIIHWHRFGQKINISDTAFREYPMDKVWMIPFFMRLKYGIPLLWNAPGIPFDFDDDKAVAKSIFEAVDYLSVRNQFSQQVLSDCGIEESRINVVPDTAYSLRELLSDGETRDARNRVIPGIQNYVVFHCNRFIPEQEIPGVISLLKELSHSGYTIVLLPLAYTHGDADILQRIQQLSDCSFILPEHPLSLHEIIGVLSGCSLYIGTSLHGSVTAGVFGQKVVSYDYQCTKKTRDLYTQLGLEKYYTTNVESLIQAVHEALHHSQDCNFEPTQKRIERHFATITSMIQQGETDQGTYDQAAPLAEALYGYFNYKHQVEGLATRNEELNTALNTNLNFVQIFKHNITELEQVKADHENEIESLKNANQLLYARNTFLEEHPIRVWFDHNQLLQRISRGFSKKK
ncbi:MAG: polysaccharide pyruvyl transferase family protein [Bifidobacterium crudilactis]|jgi:polysaccharide pyruvyl transferase WcaK-like protein|nr:polysaccharide pyruvyl transferase family protein [Bifidobacterium crudilactis]